MAVITFVKRGAKELAKGADKIFKRVIRGKKGSPFEYVDDLGAFPVARDIKDLPGTEIKKLKMIGERVRKGKKLKKLKDDVEMNMGGRVGYKSGTRGCKLALRGKGRAYGKNS